MAITIDQYAAQNYLTIPIQDGHYMIALSGVALLDLKGGGDGSWIHDTALMSISLDQPLRLTGHPSGEHLLAFALQQWTPLVTPSAFSGYENFGVAVDSFYIDWEGGSPLQFIDLYADVATRDNNADLWRIGYSLLLIGDVVEVPNPADR